MKKTIRTSALLLAVMLIVSLCGCAAGADPRAEMAGIYTFYAMNMD